MLNEYKERKMAEYRDSLQSCLGYDNDHIPTNIIEIISIKFISDLIDEMVEAIPEKDNRRYQELSSEGEEGEVNGGNECRETLIKNLTK